MNNERPKIKSITSFGELIDEFCMLGRGGWIFRGHSDRTWKLETSLTRHFRDISVNDKIKQSRREKHSIREFKQSAHLYLNKLPEDNDDLSWLALMQHYGTPTRMLDFTLVPTYALCFAVTDPRCDNNSKVCIHAIHLQSIKKHTKDIRRDKTKNAKDNPGIEEYKIGEENDLNFVGLYKSKYANDRQSAQRSVFLVPSKISLNVDEWLNEVKVKTQPITHNSYWVRYDIDIPRYDVIKGLTMIGIEPSLLYPGLIGVANSIKWRFYEVDKDLTADIETLPMYNSATSKDSRPCKYFSCKRGHEN
ncbi:MAG: FRG domain-containing protein [Victivallales bacterium]